MATTEHTINDAIAQALRGTRHGWNNPGIIRSENTGSLSGSNRRPDILVTEAGVSPVAIETEVLPAVTVEVEAQSRLGEKLKSNGRPILSSVAVRSPQHLREVAGADLAAAVNACDDFELALFTGTSPEDYMRWPAAGWIKGGISDLSVLAQAATVPPAIVESERPFLCVRSTKSTSIPNARRWTKPSSSIYWGCRRRWSRSTAPSRCCAASWRGSRRSTAASANFSGSPHLVGKGRSVSQISGQLGFDLGEPENPTTFVGSHPVRLELHALLETAKGARDHLPWDEATMRHHRVSFPIKAKVLPPEEATFLWRQFEIELKRLAALA